MLEWNTWENRMQVQDVIILDQTTQSLARIRRDQTRNHFNPLASGQECFFMQCTSRRGHVERRAINHGAKRCLIEVKLDGRSKHVGRRRRPTVMGCRRSRSYTSLGRRRQINRVMMNGPTLWNTPCNAPWFILPNLPVLFSFLIIITTSFWNRLSPHS